MLLGTHTHTHEPTNRAYIDLTGFKKNRSGKAILARSTNRGRLDVCDGYHDCGWPMGCVWVCWDSQGPLGRFPQSDLPMPSNKVTMRHRLWMNEIYLWVLLFCLYLYIYIFTNKRYGSRYRENLWQCAFVRLRCGNDIAFSFDGNKHNFGCEILWMKYGDEYLWIFKCFEWELCLFY